MAAHDGGHCLVWPRVPDRLVVEVGDLGVIGLVRAAVRQPTGRPLPAELKLIESWAAGEGLRLPGRKSL
ncbi:MAG: hypothetical protein J2P46_07665 [Zavarzinella sp.]|nr:hypothetical protein [Zavarzinella sp.]